jgi:sporulation integral membrane protein YtvI
MNPVYLYRFIRLMIVVGIIVFSVIALFYLAKYTYPFIIGFAIALFINPVVRIFENKLRLPRGWATIISLILLVVIFIGLITLLIAEIVSGANYLADVVPSHVETIVQYIQDFIASQVLPLYHQASNLFKDLGADQQDTVMTNIQTAGQKIATTLANFLQNFFQKLPGLISWIPNAATVLVFSILATFFISKDWPRLSGYLTKFMPVKAKASTSSIFVDLKKALLGFAKAHLTLISITTIIVLIGLLILRVNYAITIALISGLVDLLPYLGTGVVFIPWIVYTFITGNVSLGIGLSILYVVVVVQRQVMEPKVLSSNIGVDPLATLIALFVGFKFFGFLGLIIGPVSLVIINTLIKAGVFHDIFLFIKGKESNEKLN